MASLLSSVSEINWRSMAMDRAVRTLAAFCHSSDAGSGLPEIQGREGSKPGTLSSCSGVREPSGFTPT